MSKNKNNKNKYKWLTTVTPFTKRLALFLFILLPIIAFYYGTQYQKLKQENYMATVKHTLFESITLDIPDLPESYEWAEGERAEKYIRFGGENTGGSFHLRGTVWTTILPDSNENRNLIQNYFRGELEKQKWKFGDVQIKDLEIGPYRLIGGGPCKPEESMMIGYKDDMVRIASVTNEFTNCSNGENPNAQVVDDNIILTVFISDPVPFSEISTECREYT